MSFPGGGGPSLLDASDTWRPGLGKGPGHDAHPTPVCGVSLYTGAIREQVTGKADGEEGVW